MIDLSQHWKKLPSVLWETIVRDFWKDPIVGIFWWTWLAVMIWLILR